MAYQKQRTNKYFDAFNKGYVQSSNTTEASQLIDVLQKSTLPTLDKIQTYNIQEDKDDATIKIAQLESQGKDSKTILNEIKEGKHPELAGKYVNKTVQYHLGRVEANKSILQIKQAMEAGEYNIKESNLDVFLKPYIEAQDFDNKDDTFALGFASEFTPYQSKLMSEDVVARGKINYENKILDLITMVNNVPDANIKDNYFEKLNSTQYDMISPDGTTIQKMYSNDDINKAALQDVKNIIDSALSTDQLNRAKLILQANRGNDKNGKPLQNFMSSNKPEVVELKKQLFAKEISLENIEATRADRTKNEAIAKATKEYLVENDPIKKAEMKKEFIKNYGDVSSSFLQDVNAAESLLEDTDKVKEIQKDVEMGKYNYDMEGLNEALKGVRISTDSLEKILDKQSVAEQTQNSFYTPPRENEKYKKTVKDITTLLADKLKPKNSKFDTGKTQILIADIVKQDFGDAWQEWNESNIKPPRTAPFAERNQWEKDAQAWLDNEYLNIIKKYDNENWLSAMTVKMENTTMSEFFDADEDSQLKSFYDGEITKITDKFSLEAIEELRAESKRDLIPVSDLLKSEPAIQKLINSDINIFTDDKTTPNMNEGETIIQDIMDNLGITNIDYTDDLNEVRDSIVNFDGNIVLPELEEGMFDFFTDKDEKSEEAQGQAFVEGLSKILKRPVTKTFYNANMTESDKESISKIFNINSNQLDELVAKYLQ